ncbi:hypothetical protein [Acinetobacter beijerinckii]|uniref:Uncharacterized protein n=1 Tax=Acinetobacter beijerinckii ANC 3835 TaxID=1217649 RepID=N9E438_9GAMM|nr:hypothetical protein [Acinetobacter beijerinckii]ENW05253.1 hypothetical protein F934_01217 [Acinetobacter beijerinckii ANC 3835]
MYKNNDLISTKDNKIKKIRTLDQETLIKINKAEEELFNFDQDFSLLQCVMDNYESFQSDLEFYLKNSSSTGNILDSKNFSKLIRITNKWLLNILSSFKAMIEHLETRIKRNFGKDSIECKELKKILSREYDTEFSYAFSYKLRNYIQHCGMPKLSFNINQEMNNSNEIELSLEINLDKESLLASFEAWTTVKPRLMDQDCKICLLATLENLMNSLVMILIDIKDLIGYEKAKNAKLFILELINEEKSYIDQDYGICRNIEHSGKELNFQFRILKTTLLNSVNSFEDLIEEYLKI